MGNRAVITTRQKKIGVYLHWNGGRDSVAPLLFYCKLQGYRCPEKDCYGWARLCQVIGNAFGGTNSVGIDTYTNLDTDNGDNGVYIIEDWEIVDREYYEGPEQDSYDFLETVLSINNSMPEAEQLDEELIKEEFYKTTKKEIKKEISMNFSINDRDYDQYEGILQEFLNNMNELGYDEININVKESEE